MEPLSDAGSTSLTLLGRLLQRTDPQAWATFVGRYGPAIYGWCRKWRLQTTDAEDVTQCVLVKVVEKLPAFRSYQGSSFRGWLRTLTQHALSDFLAERRRIAPAGIDGAADLDSVEARQDLLARLEEAFDLDVLEEATTRVRQRIDARTWEAFQLMAVDGLSGAEAAARLGMPLASVFKAHTRVQASLQAEVKKLNGEPP